MAKQTRLEHITSGKKEIGYHDHGQVDLEATERSKRIQIDLCERHRSSLIIDKEKPRCNGL